MTMTMNLTTTMDINQRIENDLFEILLQIMAICCDLLLLFGIVFRISTIFIPWMIFYGVEFFVSWIIGFLLLFGKPSIFIKGKYTNFLIRLKLSHCQHFISIFNHLTNLMSSFIGDFPAPALVYLARAVLLTWIWVYGVRRYFKEVGVRLPKLNCFVYSQKM